MSPEGMKRLLLSHPDVGTLSFGNASWPRVALRDFPWPATVNSLTLCAIDLPPDEIPKLAQRYAAGEAQYQYDYYYLTLDRCRNLPELLPLLSQLNLLTELALNHGEATTAAWLTLKIPANLSDLDLRHSPVPKELLAVLAGQLSPDRHLWVSAFGTGLTRDDFAPWPQLESNFDAD
jgi:hypothetical protein